MGRELNINAQNRCSAAFSLSQLYGVWLPKGAPAQGVKSDLPDLQLLGVPPAPREVYGNCWGQHLGSSGPDNREEPASQRVPGTVRGQEEKGPVSQSPFSLFLLGRFRCFAPALPSVPSVFSSPHPQGQARRLLNRCRGNSHRSRGHRDAGRTARVPNFVGCCRPATPAHKAAASAAAPEPPGSPGASVPRPLRAAERHGAPRLAGSEPVTRQRRQPARGRR